MPTTFTSDNHTSRGVGQPLRRLCVIPLALFALLALGVVPLAGQEREPAAEGMTQEEHSAEHEYHHNHFGGLLGATIHHDSKESGFTLGLDYTRQFSRHWGAAVYVEQVASDSERDLILAVGVTHYPVGGLSLILAPGVEGATREVEESGEVNQENEYEFLMRFGVGYAIRLTSQAGLGPIVLVDRAGDRWSTVISLGMVVGF